MRCTDKEGLARAVVKTLPTAGYLSQMPPNVYNVKGDRIASPPVRIITPSNMLYFNPPLNFAGESKFTYYCVDESGAVSSDAEVIINIAEFDDFPVVGGSYDIHEYLANLCFELTWVFVFVVFLKNTFQGCL